MADETYRKNTAGQPIALEAQEAEHARLKSPSTARNRDVIRDVFLAHMPHTGLVIEIGAGTGEHAIHIAPHCPGLIWQPSDPDPHSRASIDAWRAHAQIETLKPALNIDVTQENWPEQTAPQGGISGVMSCNMIHIAPFEAARGLIAGAGKALQVQGKLFLYGPFLRHGETAPSNRDFDASLKRRDPRWGVRDLDQEITPLAAAAGLALEKVIEMPANNLAVFFEKT